MALNLPWIHRILNSQILPANPARYIPMEVSNACSLPMGAVAHDLHDVCSLNSLSLEMGFLLTLSKIHSLVSLPQTPPLSPRPRCLQRR